MNFILIKRHLKLFIKKPGNIILSLLSSLVILSLYFLFIRDFTIKAVSDYGFMSNINDLFVDRLMVSGLLIVIGATSVLGIASIFMNILHPFLPLKRYMESLLVFLRGYIFQLDIILLS